jgi:thioredoxin 1
LSENRPSALFFDPLFARITDQYTPMYANYMNSKIIILAIVLILITGGIFLLTGNQPAPERPSPEQIASEDLTLPVKKTFSCQVDADCGDLLQYFDPPAGCTSFAPRCEAGTCRVACDEFEPQTKKEEEMTPAEALNEMEELISPEPIKIIEPEEEQSKSIQFSGTVLAGSQAPLIDFNQSDYQAALASDKLVVLYFYATWCPICRNEVSNGLYPAFNELNSDKVVGFRVNYNDSDTDGNEKDLAKQFNVTYQHTKVFLLNGQRVLKSPATWNKQKYWDEINDALAS